MGDKLVFLWRGEDRVRSKSELIFFFPLVIDKLQLTVHPNFIMCAVGVAWMRQVTVGTWHSAWVVASD